ncbi:T255B protein, partial [Polyodon spathula]|nr:T255B protein [Polyodon spathula]
MQKTVSIALLIIALLKLQLNAQPFCLSSSVLGQFAKRRRTALWFTIALLVLSLIILVLGIAAGTRTGNVDVAGYYPGIILSFGSFLALVGINLVENRRPMLVASIIFISIGVIAAFFCAIVDGVIAAEFIEGGLGTVPKLSDSDGKRHGIQRLEERMHLLSEGINMGHSDRRPLSEGRCQFYSSGSGYAYDNYHTEPGDHQFRSGLFHCRLWTGFPRGQRTIGLAQPEVGRLYVSQGVLGSPHTSNPCRLARRLQAYLQAAQSCMVPQHCSSEVLCYTFSSKCKLRVKSNTCYCCDLYNCESPERYSKYYEYTGVSSCMDASHLYRLLWASVVLNVLGLFLGIVTAAILGAFKDIKPVSQINCSSAPPPPPPHILYNPAQQVLTYAGFCPSNQTLPAYPNYPLPVQHHSSFQAPSSTDTPLPDDSQTPSQASTSYMLSPNAPSLYTPPYNPGDKPPPYAS